MEINLSGKKALVGGSSSGIGKAIAVQLAKCGAQVTLMSRSEEKLIAVLNELDVSKGQRHNYIVTDFNNYEAHKQNIQHFFKTNSVDILLNNTNGPAAGDICSKSEVDYQQAFELLFQNAVFTTQQALPYMKKQHFGRIINVSSMTVKEPQDTLVLSNIMRTALVSWSKSLANAVGVDGITVNSIQTGYFETDRLTSLMKIQSENQQIPFEKIREEKMNSVPVKRLGLPEEYGYLTAFLASEYASYLTGTAIPLDGGIAKTLF